MLPLNIKLCWYKKILWKEFNLALQRRQHALSFLKRGTFNFSWQNVCESVYCNQRSKLWSPAGTWNFIVLSRSALSCVAKQDHFRSASPLTLILTCIYKISSQSTLASSVRSFLLTEHFLLMWGIRTPFRLRGLAFRIRQCLLYFKLNGFVLLWGR